MVVCYPVRNKAKSVDICRAFASGCGGDVMFEPPKRLRDGAAFFYGVDESNLHLWRELRDNPTRDFYYCDNSYFDSARQTYFRVTKNKLQHSGVGGSNCRRFDSLRIPIQPRRRSSDSRNLLVCPQSEHFMTNIVGYRGSWTHDTMEELHRYSFRAVCLRLWSPDKGKLSATLEDDLDNAFALVTWSSAASVTAILYGVPVFCSKQCAAACMGNTDLKNIENPFFPQEDAIRNWAGVLADNQWTLDEMRNGKCWSDVQ